MSGLFNKLPGFQRSPPGRELWLLRRLPSLFVVGTLILGLVSLLARVPGWLAAAPLDPTLIGLIDIYVISLIILHWTVVFTVGLAAFIVMIMKGPAYIADPYPLNEADDGG